MTCSPAIGRAPRDPHSGPMPRRQACCTNRRISPRAILAPSASQSLSRCRRPALSSLSPRHSRALHGLIGRGTRANYVSESLHTFANFKVRLATQPNAATVANWFPGMPTAAEDDLVEALRRYGGQRACLTAQACTQLAARRSGVPIGFDEILQELAYKRPAGRVGGREHRRAAKREAYAHIVLGQWAVAVGDINRTIDGRCAGREAWALYAIDHVSFEADGTPAAITFLPVGLSRLIAENPAFLEYLGNVHDVLALPNTTPGRWAAAILYALRLHWRLNVRGATLRANSGGERHALEFAPIARSRLFAVMSPDPPTPADFLAGGDARRAIGHFEEAMRILQGRRNRGDNPAIYVSFWRGLPTPRSHNGLEPWELVAPGSKPRVGQWRDAWLEQRLDVQARRCRPHRALAAARACPGRSAWPPTGPRRG